MTISSTVNRVSYAGNGATTNFSFPYKFLANADLVVIEKVDSTGVETVKTITTHYTVTGAGASGGGSITMLVAPASGRSLIIYRDPSPVQELDLVENDPMPAEEIEENLDKGMMVAQRLKSRLDRAARLPEGFTDTFDTTLPALMADNPEAMLMINSDGDGFDIGPTADEVADAEGNATAAAASAAASAASAAAAATSEGNAATSESNAADSAAAAATSESNVNSAISTHNSDTTNVHGITDTSVLVTGPINATDNAIARMDGTTGKTIQNSVATMSDAGNIYTPGDLLVNGAATTSQHANLYAQLSFYNNITADSATTGANATLALTTPIIRVSNASLTSIDMISSTGDGRHARIINQTGGTLTINNNTGGTTTHRIKTGTGAAVTVPDEATATLVYDGTEARWMVVSVSPLASTSGYKLGSKQIFTSSGTWTKPANCLAVVVEECGGGGGGGGTTANAYRCGTGGSGAAYAWKLITSGLGSSETVTIGAGGAKGTTGAGSAGGNTSFGSHVTANGGAAGTGNNTGGASGVPGTTTTSNADYSVAGGASGAGIANSTATVAMSGFGGNSFFGKGAGALIGNAPGVNADANAYGAGGSGSCNAASATARDGGDGAGGIVIVWEYY